MKKSKGKRKREKDTRAILALRNALSMPTVIPGEGTCVRLYGGKSKC